MRNSSRCSAIWRRCGNGLPGEAGALSMGAQGTAIVNFGAFPGKGDASVAIVGQADIIAGSLVEAWIRPEATAEHSADEHMVEPLRVFAAAIVAGVGFTIFAFSDNRLSAPLAPPGIGRILVAHTTVGNNFKGPGDLNPSVGGALPMVYGQWTLAWVWN